MQPYKLMVIDDRLHERKSIYQSVLSAPNFELIFADSHPHLRDIVLSTPVDAYVVDAILDQGSWSDVGDAARLFSTTLNKPPRLTPIFLVSGLWGEEAGMNVLNELIRNRYNNVEVLRYLAWQEFEDALRPPTQTHKDAKSSRLLALRNKLLDDLKVWHERSKFTPAPNDPIRILLLADVQYGDPHTSKAAVFDEHWVGNTLNRHKLKPHFVVLAGDIGATGDLGDYLLARDNIENNLLKHMWGDGVSDWRERIILVPGNHDVNLRIAACDHHNWIRDDKKWESRAPKVYSETPGVPRPINYNDFALEPFRKFARDITGSRQWDASRISCRVDRRFEQSGLRFYLFNSISNLTVDSPKRAMFSDKALGNINTELGSKDKPEDFFSIAISHHGIQFGGTREQIENWEDTGKQFFNMHHIKLWMFGHYHAFKKEETDLTNGKLGLIQAATLKIRPEEGNNRGFSLIELVRSNNEVVEARVYPYELDKDGVKIYRDKKGNDAPPHPVTAWKKS